MSPRWRWFLPGYIWALPVTIAGLFMAVVVYRCTSYKWIEGVLTCVSPGPMWGNPDGQTLGWISMYSSEAERDTPYMRVHEFTHVWQCFVLGIFWAILYGLFFFFVWCGQSFGPWYNAYRANPFEDQAYNNEDAFKADAKARWGSA